MNPESNPPIARWHDGSRRLRTRRQFLLGTVPRGVATAAVAGTALATTGTVIALEALRKLKDNVYGRYLRLSPDGTLILSDKPEVAFIKLTPAREKSTRKLLNDGKIPIRQTPYSDYHETLDLNPDQIHATHAIRIAGGTFSGQNPQGESWGQLSVKDNNRSYTFGEWFAFTDPTGTFYVDPNGSILNPVDSTATKINPDQVPYYVAANFVTPNQQRNEK